MDKGKILHSVAEPNLHFVAYFCSQFGITLGTSLMLATVIPVNQSLASEAISENTPQNFSSSGEIKPEKELISQISVKSEKMELDLSENITNIESSQLDSYSTSYEPLPIKNKAINSVSQSQNISSQIKKNVETSRSLINRAKLSKEEKKEQRLSQKTTESISSNVENNAIADANQLRRELLIEPIVIFNDPPAASPASTAGTPSAYGASSREAFIGGGISIPLESGRDRVDGSLSAGFGLGNPVKDVGVEVSANISSVSPNDFGDSGGIGLKLHRYLGDSTSVAVGWSNAIRWGDATGAKNTIYGVVTKAFPLQPSNPNNKLPLTVSVGLGSGSFRSKGAIESNENGVNVFGSLGLRVAPQVSLVSSWTGNALNAGVSFVPFKKTPLVVNAVVTDVTSNLTTGRGLSLSAGYSFRF
jgi:hypothetical protein